MNTETGNNNSDKNVADAIVKRFIAASLLPESYATRCATQLAEGAMREEDWRLLAENALEFQARRTNGEQ